MLKLLVNLQLHPTLKDISLNGVFAFVRIASRLKREILQVQPLCESDEKQPPSVLPISISIFLGQCFDISPETLGDFWNIIKEHVWDSPVISLEPNDYCLFKEHGWALGLS